MKKPFILMIAAICAGCTLAQVNVEVIGERTSLENQVLGSYNALDNQMLLAASVRGVDSSGKIDRPPAHSKEYKNTINAMQTIDFHADDLDRFKRLGWVGENNQGLVEPFAMDRSNVPVQLKDFADRYSEEEFAYVVATINEAREKIMRQVVYMNENLDESQLPEVRGIFAKINRDKALSGEKIQDPDGNWVTKKVAP